ncbi:acyl-CoA dehydrogenase family protein [Burkholderia sp. BCC1993]|uniref:acyl-CoA dehydrogenase family protein n=1 Tax=Burkholderia sp. BCC1993 TaxID=2817444 RepID=UPI002AB04461|nr:acyl-CoA dehydrogenase family protein [Burkholderia sp. BCC1993]
MDFRYSDAEQAFIRDVRVFLSTEAQRADADEIMAPDREADSMLADSAERRAFNKRLSERGFLGIAWPHAYGGQAKPGIYDYLVNEELAARGAPLIGKGVGCIGKTLIRHGSEKLQQEFLPQILRADIEFALGYSEPGAGSDLASLTLKAEQDGDYWILNGQKTWTTSAHFADWYWVAARSDPSLPKHKGISVFLVPMNHPGLTIHPIETMGDHRTNQVFFDDVRVHKDYLVGEVNGGWIYICEALDFERFTLFTVSPLLKKFEALLSTIKTTQRDGRPLSDDPVVRREIARLATDVETAKMLQRRVLAAACKGGVPAVEAAMCKLYSTELGQRLADFALDTLGAEALLRNGADGAIAEGKWEHSYRATVVDTIGGGSSEVQKNIIARRGLELPLVN